MTRLNWQVILPALALVMATAGTGMAVCALVAVAYGDGAEDAFAWSALIALALAGASYATGRRLPAAPVRARDGFFAVTAVWVVAAAVGSLPFLFEGTFVRPSDAFFESMSGFTTTGATLIGDIEAQPRAVLLWRSLTQWIGGIGFIVLVVAVVPATGLVSQRFFYAETSGVTAERLTPRIADTAKIIAAIYGVLTAAGFLAYRLAGMSSFDAVNHIFTTVATGGHSTRQESLAAFDSLSIEVVAMVFMVLGGINFAFYWRAIRGGVAGVPQFAEVRAYLGILAVASTAVAASLLLADDVEGVGEAARAGGFTVISIMTGTGYSTADFNLWNEFARALLLMLMFVGGCAGSATGGMKVVRTMLLARSASQEVKRQLQPKAVQVLRVRDRVFTEEVRRNVLGFFFIYMLVFALATMALAAVGLDLVSAASSAAATLNVVGPGLGDVGATENYEAVPTAGLWVLDACMLIGRLEVFTVLVLLLPAFWARGRS